MSVRAPLREAADSLAKASTPEPFSSSRTSNWVARGGGLPAYIQHIAHDLMEKRGKSESNAIQMAIGIVKRWARGGGNVDANTRAAASKAVVEWEKLKAGNAAKGAGKVAEASIADERAVRDAALVRLVVFEQRFGIDGMVGLLAEQVVQEAAAWQPTLKRTASASNEVERHEVYDGGQHVGTVSRRRGYGTEGDRYAAHAVNGSRVTDMSERSRQGALDALRKHLEEAPSRVLPGPSSGKFLVAQPQSYSGQTTYAQLSSEAAARHMAGLPPAPTGPEAAAKLDAVAEMLRFDLMSVSGLDIGPLRRVQEAAAADPFELAEAFAAGELRDFRGRWERGGGHGVRSGTMELSPRSVASMNTRRRQSVKPDTQRRYEGGVRRISAATQKRLSSVFTAAEASSAGRQKHSELAPLYQQALQHKAAYHGILEGVSRRMAANLHDLNDGEPAFKRMQAARARQLDQVHVIDGPMKTLESAERKVRDKYGGDASRVKDLLRGTIAVPHVDDLEGAVHALRASLPDGWTMHDAENRFTRGRRGDSVNVGDANGYRDISVVLRSPEGHNTEVQITTTHMEKAKEGPIHKLYAERRVLAAKPVLTRAEKWRIKRIDEMTRELSEAALRRSSRPFRSAR